MNMNFNNLLFKAKDPIFLIKRILVENTNSIQDISQEEEDIYIEEKKRIKACIRPYKPKKLELEILNTRISQWFLIHTEELKFVLNTNDYVEYKQIKYKVLEILDSSDYGFIVYKVANLI